MQGKHGQASKDNDLVGTDLEGYHISAELHSHSSNRTFSGKDPSPLAPYPYVMIKLLPTVYTDTEQERQRVLQEIASLRQLSHTHILPVLSAGIYKNMPYFITEYIASGSLQDRLQKRPAEQPLEQEEALSIFAQIAHALHYAHQRHVIHGNLKPQNVLFGNKNEVLVADFHLDAPLPPEMARNASSERTIYLAPEQLSGNTCEASDQYVLGCIAYEMFTGHKAFLVPSVKTPGTYYRTKSLIAPGQFNPALPFHIEEAILRSMSREPDQRYHNIPAFLAAMGLSPAAGSGSQEKVIDIIAQIPTVNPDAPTDPDLPRFAKPAPAAVETAELELLRNTERRLALPEARQRLATRRSKIFVISICLIATIVAAVLFHSISFSDPLKNQGATPYMYTTALTATSTPVPALTYTPSVPPASTPTRIPAQRHVPTSRPTPVTTPVQVPLVSFFDNEGIGNTPGQANFDASGYSYPASQLPASGQITVQGILYEFPANASGTNDNIIASGQTIPLTAGHYRQAFFLMSASWGPASGTVTIRYTDGSTTTTNLIVADWIKGSISGLSTAYRYSPYGIDHNAAYIYVFSIMLDSTRTTSDLILPQSQSGPYSDGHIHVFALTLQP